MFRKVINVIIDEIEYYIYHIKKIIKHEVNSIKNAKKYYNLIRQGRINEYGETSLIESLYATIMPLIENAKKYNYLGDDIEGKIDRLVRLMEIKTINLLKGKGTDGSMS